MSDFLTGIDEYEKMNALAAHMEMHLPVGSLIHLVLVTKYRYDEEKGVSYHNRNEKLWKDYRDSFKVTNCVVVAIAESCYHVELYGYSKGSWVYKSVDK